MVAHPGIFNILICRHTGNIIQHLEAIFSERSPPQELLADNKTAFSSGEFREFSTSWGVRLQFRCAYVSAGNGIVERYHRSIKRIAARTSCSVREAVYWYNVVPKDDTSSLIAPANGIYWYEVRIRNIDPVPTSSASAQNWYRLGDPVWVKPPRYRCTSKFQEGTVTEVISLQSVIGDGVTRHVKGVRPRTNAIPSGGIDDEDVRLRTNAISSGGTDDETSDDTGYITMPGRQHKMEKLQNHPCDEAHAGVCQRDLVCVVIRDRGGVENAWRGKRHGGGCRNGNARAQLDWERGLYSFA